MRRLKHIIKFWHKRAIYLLVAVFTFVYTFASWIRHNHFESFAYDLGIYDQGVWLLSQFKFPYSTIKEMIIWGDHFSPSLSLAAPFYWLWSDVRVLLFLQALVICVGAIPIYFLGKKYLESNILPLVIAFSYLVYFGLQNGLLFDFHLAVIYVGLIPWLFYFADKKRWLVYFLLTLILIGLKEDAPIVSLSIGLFILFKYRNYLIGLATIFLSIVCLFVITQWFIPFFNPLGFHYQPELPVSLSDWWAVLTYPAVKIKTLIVSFLPFGFLPIFSGAGLIPIVIHFLEHFVGKDLIGRWDIYLHYRAPLGAFMAIGTIFAIGGIKKRLRLKKRVDYVFAAIILASTFFTQYYFHLPLNTLAKRAFYQKHSDVNTINYLIGKIPKDASVVSQNNIASHLTHREKLYLFPKVQDADYVLINLRENQPANNFFNGAGYQYQEAKTDLEDLVSSGKFGVVERKSDIYLLKRNEEENS